MSLVIAVKLEKIPLVHHLSSLVARCLHCLCKPAVLDLDSYVEEAKVYSTLQKYMLL